MLPRKISRRGKFGFPFFYGDNSFIKNLRRLQVWKFRIAPPPNLKISRYEIKKQNYSLKLDLLLKHSQALRKTLSLKVEGRCDFFIFT